MLLLDVLVELVLLDVDLLLVLVVVPVDVVPIGVVPVGGVAVLPVEVPVTPVSLLSDWYKEISCTGEVDIGSLSFHAAPFKNHPVDVSL